MFSQKLCVRVAGYLSLNTVYITHGLRQLSRWFILFVPQIIQIEMSGVQAVPTLFPDGFIYLRATPETCLHRLQKRARGEELDIDIKYLLLLHEKHEQWLMGNRIRECICDYDYNSFSGTL